MMENIPTERMPMPSPRLFDIKSTESVFLMCYFVTAFSKTIVSVDARWSNFASDCSRRMLCWRPVSPARANILPIVFVWNFWWLCVYNQSVICDM